MNLRHRLLMLVMGIFAAIMPMAAATMDQEGYPLLYVLGNQTGWQPQSDYQFTRVGDEYSITLQSLDGLFKIGSDDWKYNLGKSVEISQPVNLMLDQDGPNMTASNLQNVTIKFTIASKDFPMTTTKVYFGIDGKFADDNDDPIIGGDDMKDAEGYPILYIRGSMTSWGCMPEYRFTRTGSNYSITLPSLDGDFKIGDKEWAADLGDQGSDVITGSQYLNAQRDGGNFHAQGLTNVTISFGVESKELPWNSAIIMVANNGVRPEDQPIEGMSGTLPVLYINVYQTDEAGNFIVDAAGNKIFDNEIIDPNLPHKNYFNAEYWLDVNDCQWLIDLGAKSVGSKDEPLATQIKARGNYTRIAFAKKPFKLKLGKKQNLLGLTPDKSKHYAILAHADDSYGYLRNFTGFNLGKRIGLPWTPGMQPVEVVINRNYRGLYFLTESIRVGDGRIKINELDDNVSDPALVSGGYLVELDNYDEENQIQLDEKSCAPNQYLDKLRITWDTPEEYSDLQRQFVTDQFTAMNNYVGANSNDLWKYMDLDDAARYYIAREIVSDVESYHGSTYMFRDRGEGQKWHFSPIWDCGNAFNGSPNAFFYDNDPYGNTWIPSLRQNAMFNDKVVATWKWFMSNCYDGITDDMATYVEHIKPAVLADYERWKDAPIPNQGQSPVDNRDMDSKLRAAIDHLNAKTNWLRNQWGDYNGYYAEPEHDTTPAAPLPGYAAGVEDVNVNNASDAPVVYYDIFGRIVNNPAKGQIVIRVQGNNATKVLR